MTRGPVEDYLDRLERELRQRGIEDARIMEEAREHLLDAVEDGRQRGLPVDDAAREAVERFGAPQTVAARVATERERIMGRLAAGLDTVWERKWWILTPTVLTVVMTSVASSYFFPTRYLSESLIQVSRLSADNGRPRDNERPRARFREISEIVLSRPRIERIIREFKLYEAERTREPLDELVQRMRGDIGIEWLASEYPEDADIGAFRVSYVSADPTVALTITQRLTGQIIEENARQDLQDREGLTGSTRAFIDSQIDESRRRLIAYEKTLETLRSQNGRRSLSRADLLAYEVMEEGYKTLLVKREDARMAQDLERRTIGEQFRIIDPPRLPARPLGPSRLAVNVGGGFAGLALGLVLVGVRSRSKQTPGELKSPESERG
jgi:uncharacterized protein involved in exopolysaccharide biosynthesis